MSQPRDCGSVEIRTDDDAKEVLKRCWFDRTQVSSGFLNVVDPEVVACWPVNGWSLVLWASAVIHSGEVMEEGVAKAVIFVRDLIENCTPVRFADTRAAPEKFSPHKGKPRTMQRPYAGRLIPISDEQWIKIRIFAKFRGKSASAYCRDVVEAAMAADKEGTSEYEHILKYRQHEGSMWGEEKRKRKPRPAEADPTHTE